MAPVLIRAAVETNGFDLDDALIPLDKIRHGGPARDGIPSLDYPQTLNASQASYLRPGDRVLGVAVNGRHRAYPIRILNYHEIANDIVGGQAIVVTYCPLCGTGIAFGAERNGQIVEFGVSGLLYNSDVLLYDRETESLWSQIMKTAISGPRKGEKLETVVTSHTTWSDWSTRHPDTDVLTDDTGFRRDYRADPYPGYSTSGRLYFPVEVENKAYGRKELVMGLEIDGAFKAYPFSGLGKGPPRFHDTHQGQAIEVVFDKKNQTARILDENGKEISTLMAFWFAWYAFHPGTEIYSFP